MDSKRRTGRTTRMLEAAQHASETQDNVYIVGAHAAHVSHMRSMAREQGAGGNFVTIRDIDNGFLRGRGHCTLFWDHYTTEVMQEPAVRAMCNWFEVLCGARLQSVHFPRPGYILGVDFGYPWLRWEEE